ncbi:MAG: sigma-70 family RNA polymerase sigma factor, partial [Planctomycetota bacterium]
MEPEPMPSFPEQALSEHGSFVRRLARKLLADAHLADDVAQEAWSRYFAAPPASANPRGWLARTVRNLATNTLRARSRRAEHEQRGARPEALRSGADEAEQAEVLRSLVEAVLALEPTQRDTLLALYFRGVDAKSLALESGVPEPTVRDRQ